MRSDINAGMRNVVLKSWLRMEDDNTHPPQRIPAYGATADKDTAIGFDSRRIHDIMGIPARREVPVAAGKRPALFFGSGYGPGYSIVDELGLVPLVRGEECVHLRSRPECE